MEEGRVVMLANGEDIQANLVGELNDFEQVLDDFGRIFLCAVQRVVAAVVEVIDANFKRTGRVSG